MSDVAVMGDARATPPDCFRNGVDLANPRRILLETCVYSERRVPIIFFYFFVCPFTCIFVLKCYLCVSAKKMNDKETLKDRMPELAPEKLEEALALLEEMEAVDRKRGYERVVAPVRRRVWRARWRRRMMRAAVVLLPLAAGMAWLAGGSGERGGLAGKGMPKAVPGEACLIVDGRQHILLDSLEVAEIRMAGGVTFHKEGKRMVYTHEPETAADASAVINELIVPRGGEFHIVLADGTQVWLNADSRMKYPSAFNDRERWVQLEGEAYFEVTHDSLRPFRVETRNQRVRVLGTKFNVCAYPEDEVNYTTLVEGSVEVNSGKLGAKEVLKPGLRAALDVSSGAIETGEVDVRKEIAWKEGMHVFDNLTLEQIMNKLVHWYDIEVFFRNDAARRVVYKGNLPRYSEFSDVLEVLKKSSRVGFQVNNKTVVVTQ